MTLHSTASLTSILLTGLLFIAAPVYAESDVSLMQNPNLFNNNGLENKQDESSKKELLRDMVFEQGIDKLLRYNIGVNRAGSLKVYSSLGLKLRTELTYLQFKMTF